MPIVPQRFLPQIKEDHSDERAHRREIARRVNQLVRDEGLPWRWAHVAVPALSAKARGTNDPTLAAFQGGTYAWSFDAATEQELYFAAELPSSWAEGTNLQPNVRWSPSTTLSGTAAVIWGLEYTWAAPDAAFPAAASLEATDTAAAQYAHQVAELGTITGTGKTTGAILVGRVYRKAAAGGDTYAHGAFLHGINIAIRHDARGAQGPYEKWIRG